MCSGCGGPLVPEEPGGHRGAGSRVDPGADDGSVAYDLDGWTPAQCDALELLLTGRDIPHHWSRTFVVVPAARADDVDDLLDGLGPEPPVADIEDQPIAEGAVDQASTTGHCIAGPVRRLLGAAVDGAVWTAVRAGLSYVGPLRDAPFAIDLTMAGVIAAYEVVSVAVWGRTLGKLVAGTRVVALGSGATPGWPAAFLRWAVPSIVLLTSPFDGAGLAAGVAFVFSNIVTIAVYLGVLRGPRRQGLHDKVAGTVVVLASRRDPSQISRSIALRSSSG